MRSAGGNSYVQLLTTAGKNDAEPDLTDAADRDVARRGPGLVGLDWPDHRIASPTQRSLSAESRAGGWPRHASKKQGRKVRQHTQGVCVSAGQRPFESAGQAQSISADRPAGGVCSC